MKHVLSWLAGATALVFGLVAYSYLTLPDVRGLAKTNPETTAWMELREREALAAGKEPRKLHTWVSYGRISPYLKKAVLVAEDAAFWDHDGVDYSELQKTLEKDWRQGLQMRGASTITQQLAKNLYLSPSRNPLRKLRELIIARRLEADLEKARIFELYLNLIEWGDGIYGIEAAAHAYFGTTAAALGPSESALLAGAIINPRVLTPARPTSRLLRRQRIILSRMGRVAAPSEAVRDEPAPVEEPEAESDEDLRDDPVAAEPPPEPKAEPKAEPAEEATPSEPAPEEPRGEPTIDAKPLPFPIPSH